MSALDLSASCRVCLKPSHQFININDNFQERYVKTIMEKITNIKLVSFSDEQPNFPNHLCSKCLDKLLNAEIIIDMCRRNNEFLHKLCGYDVIDEDYDESNVKHNVANETHYENEQQKEIMKENEETYANKSIKRKLEHNVNTKKKLSFFQCDNCAWNFAKKTTLINHVNNVHLKLKRYQCSVKSCSKSFYLKTHFTIHMKIHANIKDYRCSHCGKDFVRKESLQVHLKTHLNIRSYMCKFCSKSYSAHTDLKKHIFVHTKSRPYLCHICNAGFFLKRLLYQHVNISHANVDCTSWLNGKKSWKGII
jgi:uncharacterized Zn-finger protein